MEIKYCKQINTISLPELTLQDSTVSLAILINNNTWSASKQTINQYKCQVQVPVCCYGHLQLGATYLCAHSASVEKV